MKSVAIAALGNPAAVAVKLAALRRSGRLTVLNLHRVGPDEGSTYPPLSAELFEELLKFVTKKFDVVTFRTAASHPGRRPKLILSFDDGYADFFETAMPLMQKYGVRANLNVIPECVEEGRPPFNVELEDLLGKAPMSVLARLAIPALPIDLDQPRRIIGPRASNHVRNLTKSAQVAIRDVVDAQVGDVLPAYASRMMSRAQVIEAAKTHEIGAHSYGHASLALEDADFLRQDIARCRDYFETQLGLPMTIYAVPNGSYRPEQLRLLADEGVTDILLVDERFSTTGAPVQRRFTFHAYSRTEVIYRAVGAYRWPTRSTN
ncbi:MAG: polysaccharide deacetylase family protein [Pseudomonadota bacterium]